VEKVRVLGSLAGKKEYAFIREDFPIAWMTVLVMHVKGEEPLSPDLKGLEFSTR
jgi:hypothetical protein